MCASVINWTLLVIFFAVSNLGLIAGKMAVKHFVENNSKLCTYISLKKAW